VLIANDPAFADAMLEQPPSLSGLLPNEKFIVDAAKEQRLGTLFGPELAEIEALQETIKQADMIADVARNDLQLHSQMEWPAFNEFAKPVENRRAAAECAMASALVCGRGGTAGRQSQPRPSLLKRSDRQRSTVPLSAASAPSGKPRLVGPTPLSLPRRSSIGGKEEVKK
jgi:hypothetical protein